MIRALVLALCLASPALAQVTEPSDYREDHYRDPVPATLEGAIVVGDEEAYALWQSGGTVFVDVLPRPPKPANLPKGTLWRDQPRDSIPGAIWLPNTGYGRLADETMEYFLTGLAEATADKTHPVLFFCLMDCWMSWNAAKRALERGYQSVYWYPGGTDGWTFMEYPLERVEPLD